MHPQEIETEQPERCAACGTTECPAGLIECPGLLAEQQSADRPYILRGQQRRSVSGSMRTPYFITSELLVSQLDETRPTGRTIGGLFTEVSKTGRKIAGVLRVATRDGDSIDAHGHKRSHGTHVKTTPAEVKRQLRRVRAEELQLIAEHDVEVARCEQELKDARARRAATVAEAWAKAHVVTVKELKQLAGIE